MQIIGVDCATVPGRTGVARGVWHPSGLTLHEVTVGDPVSRLVPWCAEPGPTLLAFDAPLGWPAALGDRLVEHRAGGSLGASPDRLFRRETDRHIERRLRKRPLEVGANFIARTAAAALTLLDTVAKACEIEIPLSWHGPFDEGVRVIEVYPAATLLAHGLDPRAYKKPVEVEGRRRLIAALAERRLLRPAGHQTTLVESADALDAAICLVAGADYLAEQAVPPSNEALARREGWIWARMREP